MPGFTVYRARVAESLKTQQMGLMFASVSTFFIWRGCKPATML